MSHLMMRLLGRVLMNEAQADGGGGGGADTPAAAPASAAATAPDAADATVLTPPAAPTAAEGKTPDQVQQEADAAAAAKKGDQDAPEGAPEAYADFKLADGLQMDVETLDAFKGLAKELNISQGKAQQIIDMQAALEVKREQAETDARLKQSQAWADEVKNDPDIGGERYQASVETAVKVIQAFGDPTLTGLLNDSGLGNHPALVKFCHRIGKAISEDKFVLPGSQSSTGRKSNEEVFYGGGKS